MWIYPVGNEDDPYIQVELRRENVIRLCWLPRDKRLKEGASIMLKGDKEKKLWKVFRVYKIVIPKDALHQDWKVGGLS